MFTHTDIEVANKTSRAIGAVGKNAITPRYVRDYLELFFEKDEATVLDFGAGKAAVHARSLQYAGWKCAAYEFGDNVDPLVHSVLALTRTYNVVYASNVLNVQSSVDMARATIKQVANVVKEGGSFFANFPLSPRKNLISAKEMCALLKEQFNIVTRGGGTAAAPLWVCKK